MEYLRETVIKDIADVIGDIKNIDDSKIIDKFKNNKYSSSIAKSSKDLIMTFPVICSNTLDAKTATMVSKAIERKCVTMLQLLFASQTLSDTTNTQEYINQFHKNINLNNMNVDDYINLSDQIVNDINDIRESTNIMNLINGDMKSLSLEKPFEDSLNESSLQDFKVFNQYGDTMVIMTEASTPKDFYDSRKASSDTTKNRQEEFKRQLMDNDAKKCNELVPSLLIVKFSNKTEDGTPYEQSAVVGVKARLIPVDSFEIVDKIFVKANDKNGLLKLIRATTREISFFKDFLFALDKAKVDAISNSRKGSTNRIWKALEVRGSKSRLKKAIRSSNDASAITSLVITTEEVNYLRKNYNVNLESVTVVKSILDAYNLLSICIVDESIEVVKFFFDGDGSYETLSFNSLERESGDGMYKKVINLMTKINR